MNVKASQTFLTLDGPQMVLLISFLKYNIIMNFGVVPWITRVGVKKCTQAQGVQFPSYLRLIHRVNVVLLSAHKSDYTTTNRTQKGEEVSSGCSVSKSSSG